MKTISLTDSELRILLRHYEQEYQYTHKKLKEIAGMIKKLKRESSQVGEEIKQPVEKIPEITEEPVEVEDSLIEPISEADLDSALQPATNNKPTPKKRGRKKGTTARQGKTTQKATRKKRTTKEAKPTALVNFDLSKLDWRNFILTKIRTQNEIMSADVLAELATQAYGLHHFDKRLIDDYIEVELERLVNEEYLQQTLSDDKNPGMYGYTPWFTQKGQARDEYLPTIKIEDLRAVNKKAAGMEMPENIKNNSPLEEMAEIFILDTLKAQRKLLIVEDLVSLSKDNQNFIDISEQKRSELFDKMLTKMYDEKKLGRMKLSKSDEFQYALPKWFKNDGGLKVYYIAR